MLYNIILYYGEEHFMKEDKYKPLETEKTKGLSGEDWEIIYEHGGEEIKTLQKAFTEILEYRNQKGLDEPLGDTVGELIATVTCEKDKKKIYRLFGKAILNCKKKGYLTDIKLK